MGRVGASVILTVVAVILFALAGVDAPIGAMSVRDEFAWGLVAFALAHIAP